MVILTKGKKRKPRFHAPNLVALQTPLNDGILADEHEESTGHLGWTDHSVKARKPRRRSQEADRAEAEAWSTRMEGYGGPTQPLPSIARCLNGGRGWLDVKCTRCKTNASLPLNAIRRPWYTTIQELEASLKCRSCKKGRSTPLVRMIKLTACHRANLDECLGAQNALPLYRGGKSFS